MGFAVLCRNIRWNRAITVVCSLVASDVFFIARKRLDWQMGTVERITRGILIGGALGAFGYLFGYAQSMFMAVGVGAIAGCFAGVTHAALDKRRKK